LSSEGTLPSSIISLPQGGGALHGIGEKFSPDLHTGTGNFTVPIAIPPGRNGFQPQLNLVYSTGNGNGPFGLGWGLSIPGVARKTSHGIPRYNDQSDSRNNGLQEPEDVFILSGAEDLVPVAGSFPGRREYRPRTEGLFALIERQLDPANDYWEIKSKDGLVSFYGTPQSRGNDFATTAKPKGSNATNTTRVFSWKLTETRDPFGNVIRYEYTGDVGRHPATNSTFYDHEWDQPQITRISYADYGSLAQPGFLVSVTFEYEERPDLFSDYRAGFEIRTTKRCSRIIVKTHAGQDRGIREYRFIYDNSALNRASHLKEINIIGFDDAGNPSSELPPLEFSYTKFEPERARLDVVSGADLPAQPLSSASTQLVDLHGAGLPDLLEMNGAVRYWRNLGGGEFDLPRVMRFAPSHALGDPGVQLLDANGDGRSDLMVTSGALAGFYPLKFDPLKPTWDEGSFQPFNQVPSFSFTDPEVRLTDLDGDGITDALRSGARFENFFNSSLREQAWAKSTVSERKAVEAFPNISFSDPRVKLADMTGDGLQDIVLVYGRNVEYWPNLGRGNWGPRIHMPDSPELPDHHDPRQVLIGDIDGDGLADVVYVADGSVTVWINQSGYSWSDRVVIRGTPPMNNLTTVQLVDLKGTGTTGVLWSSELGSNGGPRLYFLDLTQGVKPYLLNAMNNHMGAITRVEYLPSSHFYLEDLRSPKTRWKTPLPFPVQVVSRVDVIDDISKGKLTTEYKYHHGYWDGAEREFHGFGMVEQLDSEAFAKYRVEGSPGPSSAFRQVADQHFSPPTQTKTWFHQGAVGDEYGDWSELDLTMEYWEGDPPLLGHTESINSFLEEIEKLFGPSLSGTNLRLSRRAKRDALRSLRGNILRTELYSQDGDAQRESRPYTVTEYSYVLREETQPTEIEKERARVFFPHRTTERVTQWERGDDPMTVFKFTGDYDRFGQPRRQATVAMPRFPAKRAKWTVAVNREVSPDETRILSTFTRTDYAAPEGNLYLHDRVCEVKSFELANTLSPDYASFSLREFPSKQFADAESITAQFLDPNNDDADLESAGLQVFAHTLNYYDGDAFLGRDFAQVGPFGALTRTETLVFRGTELDKAYEDPNGSRRPRYLGGGAGLPNGAPGAFGLSLGYQPNIGDSRHLTGYYANTARVQFDFQSSDSREKRGLTLAQLDARDNRTRITPDAFWLLPQVVTDAADLQTRATYNYRVLQPASVIDSNENFTEFKYSPTGLLTETWVKGKVSNAEGDQQHPSAKLTYDFRAYERTETDPSDNRRPVFVHTSRRIRHDTDTSASESERDATIESREYSDGFGRLIQTRAQAEDWTFGQTGDDVGLPASQDTAVAPAIARKFLDRVVVSGWQTYDNKARVVEKYEPFFDQGWEFQREEEITSRGVFAQMFYDPRGQVIRTKNPDGSEQRVIFGRPLELNQPDEFEPTPWESHTYDANDLARVSKDKGDNLLRDRAPSTHHFTPSTVILDALGRTIAQLQRNGPDAVTDWFATRSTFDNRGNLIVINDALGRDAFKHTYDLLNRPLRVDSIDAGLRTSVLDAVGNLIEYRDNKGSVVLREYDRLNRPTKLWARDRAQDRVTLRELLIYGDSGGREAARAKNQVGKLIEHRDEAGSVRFEAYDFKGNLLDTVRRVISDAALADAWRPDWDAPGAAQALDSAVYQTTTVYDALNRVTSVTYPADVLGRRAVLSLTYNRAGGLERVLLDNAVYVDRIAYNAKGQRVLIAYGNNLMTRYAYDPLTFRLVRLRTEMIASPGLLPRIAAFFVGSSDDEVTLQPSVEARQDFAYSYDLVGNIMTIEERVLGCGIADSPDGRDRLIRKFEYDPTYRLIKADGRESDNVGVPRPFEDFPARGFFAGGAASANQENAPDLTQGYIENYSYDPAGNMLDLKHQAGVTSWNRIFGMGGLAPDEWANASNNRLTTVINESETHPYQLDANGNLIKQDTEKHHAWDHADRMIGYRVQPENAASPSLEARYLYGADGMRVKKYVRNQQGQVNSTTYVDGAFEHHRQTDNSGTHENNSLHVMDDQRRIALLRIGAPLDQRDASPPVAYHLGDHLGSSTVVVGGNDANANSFINREEYMPYGETSFGSFAKKRYRYSGKERDEESGLYYFGARCYAPWFTRWISCDPLGSKDGINVYQYLQDNPCRFGDSLGTEIVDVASPGRPKPVFSNTLPADRLPNDTTAAYKVLLQTNFESVITDGFFGRSWERRVPNPREGLNKTAAQRNARTECVPTTIRNYLRVVLRYDFDAEGIKKLMDAKSNAMRKHPINWQDVGGEPTSGAGLAVLNTLLPERSYTWSETKDATESSFLLLAQQAAKDAEPVIIQTETHWYLLEGVEVVNGKNFYTVRDSSPNRADKRHFEFKDLDFTGTYLSHKPSLVSHLENANLTSQAQQANSASDSIRR
jgi:RHS repeat-associated protein